MERLHGFLSSRFYDLMTTLTYILMDNFFLVLVKKQKSTISITSIFLCYSLVCYLWRKYTIMYIWKLVGSLQSKLDQENFRTELLRMHSALHSTQFRANQHFFITFSWNIIFTRSLIRLSTINLDWLVFLCFIFPKKIKHYALTAVSS